MSIQRMATATAGHSELFTLDLSGRQEVDLVQVTHEFEHTLLLWALTQSGGQMSKAARLLGVPRTTFQSKLESLTNTQKHRANRPQTDSPLAGPPGHGVA